MAPTDSEGTPGGRGRGGWVGKHKWLAGGAAAAAAVAAFALYESHKSAASSASSDTSGSTGQTTASPVYYDGSGNSNAGDDYDSLESSLSAIQASQAKLTTGENKLGRQEQANNREDRRQQTIINELRRKRTRGAGKGGRGGSGSPRKARPKRRANG